jgi:hypothetical protein
MDRSAKALRHPKSHGQQNLEGGCATQNQIVCRTWKALEAVRDEKEFGFTACVGAVTN